MPDFQPVYPTPLTEGNIPEQNIHVPSVADPAVFNGGISAGPGTPPPINWASVFNNSLDSNSARDILKPLSYDTASAAKYPSFNVMEDNEENYAQTQSSISQLWNGVVKMGGKAVSSFSEGMLSIPDAVKGMGGDNIYKGEGAQALDNWSENWENKFPNYYSHWQQAHPFASMIPFSGGAANFWGDKFLKNLGYTIGAIGAAAVQDAAVGLVTEGVGEIPMIANQVGKASLWLSKLFTGANDLDKVMQEAYQLERTAGRVGEISYDAWKTTQTPLTMERLARAAAADKVWNGARQAVTNFSASNAEAGMEARDGYNTVKKDLTDEFVQKYGYNPTGEDLTKIEQAATASANVRYGVNLALLSVSNALQFDSILKTFKSYKNALKSGVASTLEEQSGKIGLKEGAGNTAESLGELAIKPLSKGEAIWGAIRKPLPNIFTEGVFEEGGQFATEKATAKYFEDKYNGKHNGELKDVLAATVDGLGKQFGTTEGWENMILGGLTGLLTEPVMHRVEQFQKRRAGFDNKEEATQKALDALNQHGVTGLFEQNYAATADGIKRKEDLQTAITDNDIFRFKNLKAKAFYDFVKSGIDAGRYDVRIEQLKMLRDLPDVEFNKLFGLEEGERTSAVQYIDKLIAKAGEIKASSDRIANLFQNPFRYRGNISSIKDEKKQEAALKENDSYLGFEEYKKALGLYSYQVQDFNSRKAALQQQLLANHPKLTTDLAMALTSPDSLGSLAAEYEQKAEAIQKRLDNKDEIISREEKSKLKEQQKTLATLSRNIKDLLSANSYNQDQYATLHNNLLNFELNNGESIIPAVSKELTPELIGKGHDLNRISNATQVASIAYNHLFSQDGYEQFMKDWGTWKEGLTSYDYSDVYKDDQQDVGTDYGGYISGRAYAAPKGRIASALDKVEIIRLTDMGMMEVRDRDGNIQYVKPSTLRGYKIVPTEEEILAGDREQQQRLENLGNSLRNGNSSYPTESPEQDREKIEEVNRSGAQKAFDIVYKSTTSRKWEDMGPEHEYAFREQVFLNHLSGKLESLASRLRVIPITYNNQKEWGFDLIPATYTTVDGRVIDNATDAVEGAIAIVYVQVKEDGSYVTIDKDGLALAPVHKDNPQDKESFIYTFLEPATEYRGYIDAKDGLAKKRSKFYGDIPGEDREAMLQQALAARERIFRSRDALGNAREFSVSNGIPNIEQDASGRRKANTRNNVTAAGLIDVQALNRPGLIQIATLQDASSKPGWGRLTVNGESRAFPLGRPVLNRGIDATPLDNRKLTKTEAEHVWEALRVIASMSARNESYEPVLRYLNSILFLSDKRGTQSIYLQQNHLHLGDQAILLAPGALEENKDRILSFLQELWHNTHDKLLATQDPYFELSGLDASGTPQYRVWKSYQSYLLSPNYDLVARYDSGKEHGLPREGTAPLSTRIKTVREYRNTNIQEPPMVQKYVVLSDYFEYVPPVKEQPAEKVAPAQQPSAQESGPSGTEYRYELKTAAGTQVIDGKTENIIELGGERIAYVAGIKDGNLVFEVNPEHTSPTMLDPGTNNEAGVPVAAQVVEGLLQSFKPPAAASPVPAETTKEARSPEEELAAFSAATRDEAAYTINPEEAGLRRMLFREQVDRTFDQEAFLEEMKRDLPQVEVRYLKHVLKVTGGGYAWGAQRENYIYVYENAPFATPYHEKFEAVWNNFLPAEDALNVLREFRSREGEFTDRETGDKVAYKAATDHQAKEQIAEEFAHYREDGTIYKGSPAKMGFFRRLLAFIRQFVLGNPLTIARLFRRIDSAYYRNAVFQAGNGPTSYRVIAGEKVSEAWLHATMQDMTDKMQIRLLHSGFNQSVLQLLEGKIKSADLYAGIRQDLLAQYKKYIEDESLPVEDRLTFLKGNGDHKGREFVERNWDELVRLHKEFVRPLSIRFRQDKKEAETSESRNSKEYDRDIITMDAFDTATRSVRFIFATRTKQTYPEPVNEHLNVTVPELSVTGGRLLVDQKKEFYRALNELSGSSSIQEIERRLRELAKRVPNLRSLYMIYFGTVPSSRSFDQWRQRVQFHGAMSKQAPRPYIQYRDEEGKTFTLDANSADAVSVMMEQWASDVRSSHLAVPAPVGSGYVLDAGRLKTPPIVNADAALSFLEEIRFPLTRELYNKLSPDERSQVLTEARELYNYLRAKRQLPTGNGADAKARFRTLAVLAVKAAGDPFQSSYAWDGKRNQKNVLHNYVSKINALLNESASRKALLQRLPYLGTDPFCKNSLLLAEEEWQGGIRLRPISTTITIGTKDSEDNGQELSESHQQVRMSVEINQNLRGNYYTLINADGKLEWGSSFTVDTRNLGHYVTLTEFRNDYRTPVSHIFRGYLEDEMNLIRDQGSRTGVKAVTADKASRLRFLGDMIGFSNPELRSALEDFARGQGDVAEFIREHGAAVDAAVLAFMEQEVARQANFLANNQMLRPADETGEHWFWDGLDDDFLKVYGKENGSLSAADIRNILLFRTINYQVHAIELHKVYFGDPAQWKAPEKRIKLALSGREPIYTGDPDFNTAMHREFNTVGNTTLQPGMPGYTSWTEHFKGLTVDHDKGGTGIVSRNYKEYDAALGRHPSKHKYGDMPEADAQSWMLGSAYVQAMMRSSARLSSDQLEFFRYDSAYARMDLDRKGIIPYPDTQEGRNLKAADARFLEQWKQDKHEPVQFQVIKPTYTGVVNKQGHLEFHELKTSTMPLLYTLLPEGSGLMDMYVFMTQNGVDYIGPQSQHKVGEPARIPPLYDKKTGRLNTAGMEASLHEAANDFPWEHYGIIVETAGDHGSQTRISQMVALYRDNMYSSGVPSDFKGNPETWPALSEEEKRKASTIHDIFTRNETVLRQMTEAGYARMLNKLGLEEEQGTWKIGDPEGFIRFLKDELLRREMPRNLLDAIEAEQDEQGEWVLKNPLEALNNYTALKSLIWSVVNRELIRPHYSGGPKIQISAALWEQNGRQAVYLKNNQWIPVGNWEDLNKEEQKSVRLTSSDYKFYTYTEGDKQIVGMEVGIGCWFRDKLKKSPKLKNMSDQELIAYLNETEEGKELIRGVGARIPVQSMNSIEAFRVKHFLPPEYGDAIVVPSEIVIKAGSDFDVDKLNTYLKNVYVDAQGDLKAVPYFKDRKAAREFAEANNKQLHFQGRLLEALQTISLGLEESEETERFINKNTDLIDKYYNGEDVEDQRLIDEMQALAARQAELLYREGLENEYFRTLEQMVLLPENFEQLLSPNHMSDLEQEGKDILAARKSTEEHKEEKTAMTYGKLLSPMSQLGIRQRALVMKAGVALAASQKKLATVMQRGNVVMPGTLKLPYNAGPDGQGISLSRTTDQAGKLISDGLSQAINGAVDAVNTDFLLASMLGNFDNFKVTEFLKVAGVPDAYIWKFVNQPIVQEFLRQRSIDKALRQLRPGYRPLGDMKIYKSVLGQYNIGSSVNLGEKGKNIKTFDLADLEKAIVAGKPGNMSEHQQIVQGIVLYEYLQYRDKADQLFAFGQGLSWDNAYFSSGTMVDVKEASLTGAVETKIQGLEELLEGSFIGAVRDHVWKSRSALAPVLLMERPEARNLLSDVSKLFTEDIRNMDADTRARIMQKAELSLLDFLVQNYAVQDNRTLNSYIHSLLVDKETGIAAQWEALRKTLKGDLKSNPAVQAITSIIQNNVKGTRNVGMPVRPDGAAQIDMLSYALTELRDHGNPEIREIYQALVLASILQSGTGNSRISFSAVIPNEDYARYLTPAVQALKENSPELQYWKTLHAFQRNNWGSEDIVPTVSSKAFYKPDELQKISPDDYQYIIVPSTRDESKYPVLKVAVENLNPRTGIPYTKEEKAAMRANQDYSYRSYRLFQQVTEVTIGETPHQLYKEINPLGNGMYAQEYYPDNRPSVIPTNRRVDEVSDGAILEAISEQGPSLYESIGSRQSDILQPTPKGIPVKEGVSELFKSNPELSSIGTQEQYSQYLDTIFPESKVKDIVYHGTNSLFDKFDINKNGYVSGDSGFQGEGFYFYTNLNQTQEYNSLSGNKRIIFSVVNINNTFTNTKEQAEKIGYKYNPLMEAYTTFGNKEKARILSERLLSNKYDSVLDGRELTVFNASNIHILGSKQDIEGFKKWNKEELNNTVIQGKSQLTPISPQTETPDFGKTTMEPRNIFTVTPIQPADKKAIVKASLATKFIGYGEGLINSSTEHYRKQVGRFANIGEYNSNDVVFVSVPGRRGAESVRKAQQDKTIREALKAIESGATLLTDNKAYLQQSDYNEGERRLAKNLEAKGYQYSEQEINGQKIGIWKNPQEANQTYKWARYAADGYEVSSQGDNRFSALNAHLKDGRTIEEAYQLDIKGFRQKGNDWRLGKGKAPLRNISKEQSWQEYKSLWRQFLDENPQLEKDLREKSSGKTLTDKFASTNVSQARALAELLNERVPTSNQPVQETPDFGKTTNVEMDKTYSWGALSTMPVYSEYGVNTMRTRAASPVESFGNPFTGSDVSGLIQMKDIPEAVQAYTDWIKGDFSKIPPDKLAQLKAQRNWIIQQINSGKLDNAKLLYMNKKVNGQFYDSHADALKRLIEEKRGNQSLKGTTKTEEQKIQDKINSCLGGK